MMTEGESMGIIELLVIAIGLSADAFSVSVCKGLASGQKKIHTSLICGIWFGLFQAAMPLAGYYLGGTFAGYITKIGHWVAFAILVLIGLNMIRESRGEEDDREKNSTLNAATMLILAVATSIDALAVGVSFAFLNVRIISSVIIIGCTTFVLSFAGGCLGNLLGARFRKQAQLIGGIILIAVAVRILIG